MVQAGRKCADAVLYFVDNPADYDDAMHAKS
jgi:hypothetical protein